MYTNNNAPKTRQMDSTKNGLKKGVIKSDLLTIKATRGRIAERILL
jgi:hypothetical protein